MVTKLVTELNTFELQAQSEEYWFYNKLYISVLFRSIEISKSFAQ